MTQHRPSWWRVVAASPGDMRDWPIGGPACREELDKERRRNKDLADEMVRVEEKLRNALERNKLYEKGYGIEDAALEIDKWKTDAMDRDKALTEVRWLASLGVRRAACPGAGLRISVVDAACAARCVEGPQVPRGEAVLDSATPSMVQVLERANQYSEQIDLLLAENEVLRKKAGLKAGEQVDVSGIRSRGREEVRQLRALVSHLEMELQEREDAEMRLR